MVIELREPYYAGCTIIKRNSSHIAHTYSRVIRALPLGYIPGAFQDCCCRNVIPRDLPRYCYTIISTQTTRLCQQPEWIKGKWDPIPPGRQTPFRNPKKWDQGMPSKMAYGVCPPKRPLLGHTPFGDAILSLPNGIPKRPPRPYAILQPGNGVAKWRMA